MKANQKYFPLLDAEGKLTNQFLVVSNISPDDATAVIGGNERVVRPRLADAKFFFDQDRKKTLEEPRRRAWPRWSTTTSWAPRASASSACAPSPRPLSPAAGHDADTLVATAECSTARARRSWPRPTWSPTWWANSPSCKAPWARYYARNDGLRDDRGRRHRRPLQAPLCRRRAAAQPRRPVVALADKLETLVGMFGIGNLPTGDKDPFALRRHALGVIRILVEKRPAAGPVHAGHRRGRHLRRHCCPMRPRQSAAARLHLRAPRRLPARAGLQRAGSRCRAGPAPSAWGEMPARLEAVRAFAAAARSPRAGSGQQAHGQHPEEGRRWSARWSMPMSARCCCRNRPEGPVCRHAADSSPRPMPM